MKIDGRKITWEDEGLKSQQATIALGYVNAPDHCPMNLRDFGPSILFQAEHLWEPQTAD